MAARWIERRFERLIWKFRLISIVPVVLSLLGSVGCFVIGAVEVFNAFLVIMRLPFTTKSVAAKEILPMSLQATSGSSYFLIILKIASLMLATSGLAGPSSCRALAARAAASASMAFFRDANLLQVMMSPT